MVRDKRCRGDSAILRIAALASSIAVSPAAMTRACPICTGVDTVTGPSSRIAPFSRKMRQNSDTSVVPRFPRRPSSSYEARSLAV